MAIMEIRVKIILTAKLLPQSDKCGGLINLVITVKYYITCDTIIDDEEDDNIFFNSAMRMSLH